MHYRNCEVTGPLKISATIITLNEEKNLPRSLSSLGCCDDIVVVDSGSNDKTVTIAREYGVRVIERPFNSYADQKNFAARVAENDWILSLDADEVLSEELATELSVLKRVGPRADAYSVPRLAQYMNKWIRHSGWYPDRKIRLYNRSKARWVGEYVHEAVNVRGKIGALKGDLLHFTCQSFSQHMVRIDHYTTLAADEMISKGQRVGFIRLLILPLWTFFRTYVLQRGFLDGTEGWIIARMAAFYVFAKYVKVRTISNS